MDVLYYSNYCKHSQKLLQYLVKNNLINQINCICIDKRVRDYNTNQVLIVMEDGKRLPLPANVHNVPALLLVQQIYSVIVGDEIYRHFSAMVKAQNNEATQYNGEPMGYFLSSASSNTNIVSEQYTYYNMSSDELSAKGRGGMRQMYNYVPATHEQLQITTPPDNYTPDKVSSETSLEVLQRKRNEDVAGISVPSPSGLDAPPMGNMAVQAQPPQSYGYSSQNRYI